MCDSLYVTQAVSARFPTVGIKFNDIWMGSSEDSKSLVGGETIRGSGLGGIGSSEGGEDGGNGEEGFKVEGIKHEGVIADDVAIGDDAGRGPGV